METRKYTCTDCGQIHHLKGDKEHNFCYKCKHPIWVDESKEAEIERILKNNSDAEFIKIVNKMLPTKSISHLNGFTAGWNAYAEWLKNKDKLG